jgi:hypothetical protein
MFQVAIQKLKIKKYRTIILPVVLYECETWSPKRDEVTGEWRKLHNMELNDLHSLPNIVLVGNWRSLTLSGHVARILLDFITRSIVGE